jgi:Osmosensitive K+ channel histidine kinase
VPYAAPALRGKLPDVQTVQRILGILLLVGTLVWSTHRSRKFLARETARLTEVSRQVAESKGVRRDRFVRGAGAGIRRDNDCPADHGAGADGQPAGPMENGAASSGSRSSSFPHELTTPLAVIEGKADLLAEDEALTPEQREQVEAILRGTEQTRTYLLKIRAQVQTPLKYNGPDRTE